MYTHPIQQNMASRFAFTFAVLFIAWLSLTMSLKQQELIAGALVSLLVAAFVRKNFIMGKISAKFSPKRWHYFIAFLFNLLWQEIKAHLLLILIILYPKNIIPQVVKTRSGMRSSAGLTALANAITMTPGTLTLDVKKQELLVHCITKMPASQIAGKSEPLLHEVVRK